MNGMAIKNEPDQSQSRLCSNCAKNGQRVKLRCVLLNFEEAIFLCPTEKCNYPLETEPVVVDRLIIKRNAEDILNSRRGKRRRIDQNSSCDGVASGNLLFRSQPSSDRNSLNLTSTSSSQISSSLKEGVTVSQVKSDEYASAESRLNGHTPAIAPSGLLFPQVLDMLNSNSLKQDLTGVCDSTSEILLPSLTKSFVQPESVLPAYPTDHSLSVGLTQTLPSVNDKCKMLDLAPKDEIVNSKMQHLSFSDQCKVDTSAEKPISISPVSNGCCDPLTQADLDSWETVKTVPLSHSHQDLVNDIRPTSANIVKLESNYTKNQNARNCSKQYFVNPASADLLNSVQSVNPESQDVNSSTCSSKIPVRPDTLNSTKSSYVNPETNSSKEHSTDSGYNASNSKNETLKNKPKTHSVKATFLQWKNKDSLCWLDVLLSLLTHNKTLRASLNEGNIESYLKPLVKSYDTAQKIFRQYVKLQRCYSFCRMGRTVKLETSVGDVIVKTGGGTVVDMLFGNKAIATVAMDNLERVEGSDDLEEPFDVQNIISFEDPNTVCIARLSKEADRLYALSKQMLSDARDIVFDTLEPYLKCVRGQHDSAMVALKTLLERDPAGDLLRLQYDFLLTCSSCSSKMKNRVQGEVLTLRNLPCSFKMSEPSFLRRCDICNEKGQLLHMEFENFPATFFLHFLDGIDPCDIADLDFEFTGHKYAVTGLVQYKTNPNHFVSWLREPIADCWMECDDMKNCICKYLESPPRIPASQVHLVMWERQLENSGYLLPSQKKTLNKTACRPLDGTSLPTVASNCSSIPVETTVVPVFTPATFPYRNGTVAPPAKTSVENVADSSGSKPTTDGRIERMKQKFQLDKNRPLNVVGAKPVIPRVVVGVSLPEKLPSKDSLPQSPEKPPSSKHPRSSVLKSRSDGRTRHRQTASIIRPSSSLLKVGRQSYRDSILPLLEGSNKPLQKFEGYIPKSQKVSTNSVPDANAAFVSDTAAAYSLKNRKPKVCFMDGVIQDVRPEQPSLAVTDNIPCQTIVSRKSGISPKPPAPFRQEVTVQVQSSSTVSEVQSKSNQVTASPLSFEDLDFDVSKPFDIDALIKPASDIATGNAVDISSAAVLDDLEFSLLGLGADSLNVGFDESLTCLNNSISTNSSMQAVGHSNCTDSVRDPDSSIFDAGSFTNRAYDNMPGGFAGMHTDFPYVQQVKDAFSDLPLSGQYLSLDDGWDWGL